MSRIAGIVSNKRNIDLNKLLDCQKSTSSLKSWNNYIYKTESSIIGYTGAYNASCAKIMNVSVIIDGIACAVTAVTTTEITCTTGSRPGLPAPSMSVSINGVGNVAL